MIIQHFTDNDLYKFTTMNAVQKLYPNAWVKYRFINRAGTEFPEGFAEAMKEEVHSMAQLSLSKEEADFISARCYYFDPVFVDLLKGYRYDPAEVHISQEGGNLQVEIESYWYRTVLWEVPLMALISELYFKLSGQKPAEVEHQAAYKAQKLAEMQADFSDFGTRRRFSFRVHDQVVGTLKANAGQYLKGTSNLYLAIKYNLTPIGTHPHEWFMYHAAHFGYRVANLYGLEAWTNVYQGDLGIALTDTFTTENFFQSFNTKYAKLFDGIRWDSGDPLEFTEKALKFYQQKRINAKAKTIVFSDSLNLEKVAEIKKYVAGRIHDVYGIGTFFTNDVGVKPLNMVIKLVEIKTSPEMNAVNTIKLSDVAGKHTGPAEEIGLCKQVLQLN